MTSLLDTIPFEVGARVWWRDMPGTVIEIRGERVVVWTEENEVVHITDVATLRAHQVGSPS